MNCVPCSIESNIEVLRDMQTRDRVVFISSHHGKEGVGREGEGGVLIPMMSPPSYDRKVEQGELLTKHSNSH